MVVHLHHAVSVVILVKQMLFGKVDQKQIDICSYRLLDLVLVGMVEHTVLPGELVVLAAAYHKVQLQEAQVCMQ